MSIRLPLPVRDRLRDWVVAGYPRETCGVLLGSQSGGRVSVRRVKAIRNVCTERAGDRFQLHGEELVRADAEAEAQGLEIVGIWHSHPDHPAEPSERDRVNAWRGWIYVILSVGSKGVTQLRAWRLGPEQRFHEQTLVP